MSFAEVTSFNYENNDIMDSRKVAKLSERLT